MQAKLKFTVLTAMSVLTLSACGPKDKGLQDQSLLESEPDNTAPAEVVEPVGAVARLVDQEGAKAAMEQPLDGSSIEAFEQDMERLKSKLSNRQFNSVQSAIEWQLFYDLSVRRDKAKLYSMLDGKTPTEIIERADKIRGQ